MAIKLLYNLYTCDICIHDLPDMNVAEYLNYSSLHVALGPCAYTLGKYPIPMLQPLCVPGHMEG